MKLEDAKTSTKKQSETFIYIFIQNGRCIVTFDLSQREKQTVKEFLQPEDDFCFGCELPTVSSVVSM